MIKSKAILLPKIIIILFVLSLCYMAWHLTETPTSLYKVDVKEITGKIIKCQKSESGVTLTVQAKEKIIVNYSNDFNCQLGIKIKAKGTLKTPNSNTVFNLFNYRHYLWSQKINYIFQANFLEIIDNSQSFPYLIKNRLIDKIDNYHSRDYLHAFILGNSKEIEKDVLSTYQNNGISHLLAISGMHITLLSTILLFILNRLSYKEKRNYLLVIILLLFYAFLTGFSPSVIRATAIFVALTVKKILNLQLKTIYFLLLIASVYLLYNPYIVYHIGFLFSFIITFYLLAFQKLIAKFSANLAKTFIVSFIAFLASIPILIDNFFSVNFLSPVINVFFVPLVSFIIYPLSLITLCVPSLDHLLFSLTKFMETVSNFFNNIAFLTITLRDVPLIIYLIYYLIITYALYCLTEQKKQGLIILAIILIIHANSNYFDKYPELTMLDVGQGDSILIKLDHNKGNILIDTGGQINFDGSEAYDLTKTKTIPYLKSLGITKLDYLILTHGDFDHAGMAPNLLKNFKIKKIILNKNHDNELEKNIISLARKYSIEVEKVREKQMKIGSYDFKFLNGLNSSDENDDSLIIYTKIMAQNILLMGDASVRSEKYILDTYNLKHMDILKVGHHGSSTSTSSEFIDQISPSISLISAGKNNLYGHPHRETLKKLEDSKILITQIDGSIKLVLKDKVVYYLCPLMR